VKESQLSININKCAVLLLSYKSQATFYSYFLNAIAISRHISSANLGNISTISSDPSFERHINNIRGFLSRNLRIMRFVFITYVLPLLEYGT
jgi:hypothetical protein